MHDAGIVSPQGEPSLRRLAELTGAHVATVSRTIKGGNAKGPNPDLIKRIARQLNKPASLVASWAGEAWNEMEEYDPPQGANTMTIRQRESVDRIINAFVELNKRERTRK